MPSCSLAFAWTTRSPSGVPCLHPPPVQPQCHILWPNFPSLPKPPTVLLHNHIKNPLAFLLVLLGPDPQVRLSVCLYGSW